MFGHLERTTITDLVEAEKVKKSPSSYYSNKSLLGATEKDQEEKQM